MGSVVVVVGIADPVAATRGTTEKRATAIKLDGILSVVHKRTERLNKSHHPQTIGNWKSGRPSIPFGNNAHTQHTLTRPQTQVRFGKHALNNERRYIVPSQPSCRTDWPAPCEEEAPATMSGSGDGRWCSTRRGCSARHTHHTARMGMVMESNGDWRADPKSVEVSSSAAGRL